MGSSTSSRLVTVCPGSTSPSRTLHREMPGKTDRQCGTRGRNLSGFLLSLKPITPCHRQGLSQVSITCLYKHCVHGETGVHWCLKVKGRSLKLVLVCSNFLLSHTVMFKATLCWEESLPSSFVWHSQEYNLMVIWPGYIKLFVSRTKQRCSV